MSYDLLVAHREHLRLIGRTNGEEAGAGARRFRVPRHRLPKAVSEIQNDNQENYRRQVPGS